MINQLQGNGMTPQNKTVAAHSPNTMPAGMDQSPKNAGTSVQAEDPEMVINAERMKAGQALLDTAAERADALSKSDENKDQAELNSLSETEEGETKAPEQVIDEKLWDSLRYWQQDSQITLEENLKRLQQLFQMLQEQILSSNKGQVQLELVLKLDELMFEKIKYLLMERSLELMGFMGRYGNPGFQRDMVTDLFEQIASRKPAADIQGSFPGLLQGQGGGFGLHQKTALDGRSGQGGIYQRDLHGVRMDADYQSYIRRSEKSASQMGFLELERLQSQRFGKEWNASGRLYTPEDIRQAQTFVRYLNQHGPELDSAKLPDTSEEYIGFSAGLLSLKFRTFTDKAGIGEKMASSLEYAMSRRIQEYFLQTSQSLKQTAAFRDRDSCPPYQADDIQKVYHFVLKSHQGKKEIQSSVLESLQKAYEMFRAKQEDARYQGISRYRSDRGFFSRMEDGDMEKNLWDGWKNICRDWNGFVQYLRLPDAAAILSEYAMDRNRYLQILLSHGKVFSEGTRRRWQKIHPAVIGGVLGVCAGVGAFLMILSG